MVTGLHSKGHGRQNIVTGLHSKKHRRQDIVTGLHNKNTFNCVSVSAEGISKAMSYRCVRVTQLLMTPIDLQALNLNSLSRLQRNY